MKAQILKRSTPSPKVSSAIVQAWNARHPVGDSIIYINGDGDLVKTTVIGECQIISGVRCARIAAVTIWCCIDRLI